MNESNHHHIKAISILYQMRPMTKLMQLDPTPAVTVNINEIDLAMAFCLHPISLDGCRNGNNVLGRITATTKDR